ncbi:aminoacyl-tRNA hydrolase [Acididesulfobacillus acetoxydans]|uniref:Peptidyl-tRNA hydrolase n=1 Tax=Acididesulfobacillus acetoxydans TaxID=1561005 RepID=A0A8S0Y1S6_9FIRM|nr:aminoacyl-tRNA hydrolase [Acididesulfobacillus acetoxydans]CAA7599895.1 aminoacyl-tRNA hydrolase [Acididesulfobacillus acetoxydans]CEJ08961.1 Peptidyl-tRNA hydrolase [Acididesulfobacillus acetoxydans]
MKVIAGLGNPGPEYAETRHNVGFVLVDNLAKRWGWDFRPKYHGLMAMGEVSGERVVLFKPQTYMNLSGRAVRELAGFYKIPASEILVVHDDLDLALGRMRLRRRGGAGGHRGVLSLLAELGAEDFWRLRIGIGRPPAGWEAAAYVLGRFLPGEIELLEGVLAKAEQAAGVWLTGDTAEAMNRYNRA